MIPTPVQSAGRPGSAPSRYTAPDSNDQFVWALNDGAVGSATPASYANSGALGTSGNAMTPLSGSVFRTSPGMFGSCPNNSGFNYYGGGAMHGAAGSAGNIAYPITVSAWVLYEYGTTNLAIVGRSHDATTDTGNESIYLGADSGGTKLTVKLWIGSAMVTIIDSSNTPVTDQGQNFRWHHVGFTYDGANVKMYFDGDLVNTVAQTGAIVYTNANPWWIMWPTASGDTTFASMYPISGRTCDVRIANVARSAAWFQSVYQTGIGLY